LSAVVYYSAEQRNFSVALNVAPLLTTHDLSVLIDFLLFGATLAFVAIFHRHALAAALTGFGAITIKKLLGTGHVFKGGVRVGYLAALVAAANAGGAGSVLGDTTTTMLWIAGVSPLSVLDAYIAAVCALLVSGIPASIAQHKFAPIVKDAPSGVRISFRHVAVVGFVLAAAISANVGANLLDADILDEIPLIGLGVAAALLLTAPIARPDWSVLPRAARGAIFLIALVSAASMMPVKSLPSPGWPTTLGLGLLSAVFDNIPLTALAIKQNNHDWGLLAYAVGFGGSMIWFGSSAGIAVADLMPEAKSTGRWLREGWSVALAYVAGFFLMLALLGWNPESLS
jgi:Na+/H+ antiporter NhaD/arsenite permease-like protein